MKKYYTSKPDELKEAWPGAFTGIEGSWHAAVTDCRHRSLLPHHGNPGDPSLAVVALKTVGICIDDEYYNAKDKEGWLEWSTWQ